MKRSVSILLTVCLILSVLTNSALAVDVAGDSKNGQTTEASEAAQTGLATGKGEEWQEVLDDQKIAEQENGISPQANEILVTDKRYYSSTSPEIKVNADTRGSWVGLYPASTTSYGTSIAWYSCSGVSGDVNLKTSNIVKWNLAAWGMEKWSLSGAYKVVLFGDSGYTNVLATRYIFVGPIELSTDKDTYSCGEAIKVTTNYSQHEGWVGMHQSGVTPGSGNSVAWYYPVYRTGEATGLGLKNVNIIGTGPGHEWGSGKLTTGDYYIRVFEYNGGDGVSSAYNRLAEKKITIAHTYNQKNTSTTYRKSAATCTKAAVYYYSCTCGAKGTSTFESGNPIAHTYNQKNTSETYLKSSATCTSAAVYYYSCLCGTKGSSTFESGNALGHTYNQKNTSSTYRKSAATCTKAAVYYYSCTCGAKGTSTFESGNPIAHTYNQKNTSETYLKSSATCTSAAVYYYSCTCGAKGTSTFTSGNALGHSWTNATCTTAKTCSVCKATEGAALGHNWTDATCTDPKTCSVCKATEGEALGHNWTDATCTAPKTCSVCKATEGEALGHNWTDATCTAPKTCSVCKATEGEALGHNWTDATCTAPKTCSVCNATEGEALGHNWGEYTLIKVPTHTEAGEIGRVCTICGEVDSESIAPIKKLPRMDLQVEFTQGYMVFTGIYDDYANLDNYLPALRFGIVLVPTGSLSGELSLNTAGRTKIEFSEFKDDGTFCYFFDPVRDAVSYSARAFISYKDPATGEEVILYSDILEGSYTACEGRTLTTVPVQAD